MAEQNVLEGKNQNDLQVTIQSDLQVKNETEMEQHEQGIADEKDQNDHESDCLNTLTEEDHSRPTRTTEKPPSVHDETTTDLDKPSLYTSDDEVTSQQDAEVGYDEAKVVTEEVKVTEEATVTYEASAKQLDLLSRLAMLREKAAQRKAQQTSDTESTTQDSLETTPGEHHGPSAHRDDSTRPHDQLDGLKQLHDAPYTSTKTDVDRSPDTDKDKETLSETNRQVDISKVDADAKQETSEVTGSHGITLSTTEPGELVSETDGGRHDTIGSPSVITHDDTDVITEAQRQSSDDNKSVHPAEHDRLSTIDKPTTKAHSTCLQDVSTAELLNSDINTPTGEAAKVSVQQTQHSTNTTEICIEHNEFCSGTATDEAVKLQSADEGGDHQSALSQALSGTVHSEISGTTPAAVDVDVQSVPVHSDSENTTDQTGTDSELRGAVTVATHPDSVDSSGGDQLEPAMVLSDTSSVTCGLTETSNETTYPPDNDDTADNYDSDLDLEFADPDALQLLSHIQTIKSSKADGPGYLYVFADHPRGRFKIGASRSPAKRLRQATTFNPDITLLVFLPVSTRLAAVGELRRRLLANDQRDVITGSRDWFRGSDDVIREQVTEVAAANTTNKI